MKNQNLKAGVEHFIKYTHIFITLPHVTNLIKFIRKYINTFNFLLHKISLQNTMLYTLLNTEKSLQ